MDKKILNLKLEKTLKLSKALMQFQFNNFIENHISDVQKDIDLQYDKIFENPDSNNFDEELSKYEDEIGNEGFKFDHEFPNRIRYSSLIQTYSILEVHL